MRGAKHVATTSMLTHAAGPSTPIMATPTANGAAQPPDVPWEVHLLPKGGNEAAVVKSLKDVTARGWALVPVKLDLQGEQLDCSSPAVARALGLILQGGHEEHPLSDLRCMICNGEVNLSETHALSVRTKPLQRCRVTACSCASPSQPHSCT